MKVKRILFLVVGSLSLVIGCVGIAVPVLPTFPFLLLTAYCYARSSQRLHTWFVATPLYTRHVRPLVKEKAMTRRAKAGVLFSVTLVMGIGFAMMGRVPVARVILALVWLGHVVYFLFGIKTLAPGDACSEVCRNEQGQPRQD